MTEIEKKALELVNEVSDGFHDVTSIYDIHTAKTLRSALCRAIEQHEAFRQEVSDVVDSVTKSTYITAPSRHKLERFIISKPDPLEKLINSIAITLDANDLREALEDAGLEIREKAK